MENQQDKSEILVKATAQGFSVAIHGIRDGEGSWICSFEKSEITYTDIPINELATDLGELRDYEKTEFALSFEKAFAAFDQTEWYLCRPTKIHEDVADFVIEAFEKRMMEYNDRFPIDSPMEEFIRENKTKEWRAKAGK